MNGWGPARHQQIMIRPISIRANCAIQGIVASIVLLLWQIIYTLPRLQSLILTPMAQAHTSPLHAMTILLAITFANLLHSVTFYVTLKHFPGGATSAGVLKGLQAVLVFGVGSIVLCGRWGGLEMCWSMMKFGSLVVVMCGILVYYVATTQRYNNKNNHHYYCTTLNYFLNNFIAASIIDLIVWINTFNNRWTHFCPHFS